MLKIEVATKEQIKLRMALDGPTGSGKTYSALRFAQRIVGKSGKILVIDSERRSASKYVGENPDGQPWVFDVINLPSHSPTTYTEAVRLADKHDYDVVIIDSLSHAWMGKEGALATVDKIGSSGAGGNFSAWREVTPMHNAMVDAILDCQCHVIVTMRSKMEYAMETYEDRRGHTRTRVAKVGLAPVQRQGVEYEFDVVIDLDAQNIATVSKSRCSALSGEKALKPGPSFIDPLMDWLQDGTEAKWRPSKLTFFDKLKEDFNLDYADAADALKQAGYDSYDDSLATEMYDAVLAAVEQPPQSRLDDIDAPAFEVKPDPPPIQTLDDIVRDKEQNEPTEEPEPLDVSTGDNHEQVKAKFWRLVEIEYGWGEGQKMTALELAKQLGHEGLNRADELLKQMKFSVNGCLAYVNMQVDIPYGHLNHMKNALAKEGFAIDKDGFAIDKDGWPEVGDEAGWAPLIETLISRRNDVHPETEEVIEEVQGELDNPIAEGEVPF